VLFGEPLAAVDEATMATVAGEVPTSTVALPAELTDLLAATGLATSKSDAARVVKQGGAYVNNEKWPAGGVVGTDHLLHDRYVLLRRGKDQYHLAIVSG
jgi:tyrosyl-tRNA synthetase